LKSQRFFDIIKINKSLKYSVECVIVNTNELRIYGGRWVTGVPPGLQNQCGALGASRVGSIPTCPRQKRNSAVKNLAGIIIEIINK
jgi:hypothetical protein